MEAQQPLNLIYTVRNGEKREGTFGFVFLPTLDFEIGCTYRRPHPLLQLRAGELAPFATPSVNALKVGYRIQFSYCGKCR